MASSKEYRDFVLEQLSLLSNISFRQMMGEFIFYYNGIYFGGIYDDRFLLKSTKTNEKYGLSKEVPYKNGKEMLLIENIDDKEYLKSIVLDTVNGLKNKNI